MYAMGGPDYVSHYHEIWFVCQGYEFPRTLFIHKQMTHNEHFAKVKYWPWEALAPTISSLYKE